MSSNPEQFPVEDLCGENTKYASYCRRLNSCYLMQVGKTELAGLRNENPLAKETSAVLVNCRKQYTDRAKSNNCPFWATLFR